MFAVPFETVRLESKAVLEANLFVQQALRIMRLSLLLVCFHMSGLVPSVCHPAPPLCCRSLASQ